MSYVFTKPTKVTYETFEMVGNIDISSGFGTFADSGLTLELPRKGLYQIFFSITTVLSDGTAFDNKWVEGKLYNDTDSIDVPGSHSYLLTAENLGPNADLFINQGSIECIFNADGPKTLKLYIQTHSISAGATLSKDYSSYGYILYYK